MVSPYRIATCLLLVTHTVMLVVLASVHSPAGDEIAYLPAGLSHWMTGRFELYRANPPLVRLVAALPVLAVGCRTDETQVRREPTARSEFAVGTDFLKANGQRSFWLFKLARFACIPFSLLGLVVCQLWADSLYGKPAGLVAASLWCFSPNILGNGALITPDVASASLGALAGYLFWQWLKEPNWTRAMLAGLSLGAAELAKGIWIPLFVVFPAIWIIGWTRSAPASCNRLRCGSQILLILLLGILVINAGYAFKGTFKLLGDYDFAASWLRGANISGVGNRAGVVMGNRFRETVIAEIPVPLPDQYVIGIDAQRSAIERGRPAYLFGTWKHGGWWYYYLLAASVKIPIGTLCLLALAFGCRITGATQIDWLNDLALLAPAATVAILISTQAGINRHFRYAVPVLPFAFVWMSAVAGPNIKNAWVRTLAVALVALSCLSSLARFPHSLSYFNELAGGPRGGPRFLLGSNTDWGQDLLFLKGWIDRHPRAQPLTLCWHFQQLDPNLAGVDCPRTPDFPTPGWHIVSVNEIYAEDERYRYFLDFKPVDHVAYSMNVYHITEDDIRQCEAKRKSQAANQERAPPREKEAVP